jgi:predicted Zn-dependent protease with MMP-like domain
MLEKDFEKLVQKAVMDLPKHIREKMDNVAIVIESNPSPDCLRKSGMRLGDTLLGLYYGIPKTTCGRGFTGDLPDKITIFNEPIEKIALTPEKITELVKITVWHEIAHHFGFDEKQVRKLEKKWKKNW